MSRPTATSRRSVKTEYIETDTGNKISRRAHIEGKQNIMLGGRSVLMAGVHLRGDLQRIPEPPAEGQPAKAPTTAINIGRASIISTGTTLHPPSRLHHGKLTYYPMRIADNVFIGANSQISSASISSHVHIGENCVLGPFSMIKEGCKVLPNTVVPANMMIPPGSVVAGRPARIVGEVGDGWGQVGSGEVEIVEGGDLKGLVRTIK
ncbi:unnamed protein product [Zymoseptoria tritici ST99CH_1A5]|uniref:Dynactin subunit 5 n=2 Tax=Zymoseptoria tritici TaxID=1047171 RepID=A0A1X7RHQ2_ZYMT9|nr:unnamed protein product [Zymoseptoria tritici ST99CH_3D7]SMR45466.1 unnamed protein product [Zymoseptoria tritici ST99CH_3D1]SMY20626.1 unnamed protein product [Zymoseptoria tritici ST99CH_1A5]